MGGVAAGLAASSTMPHVGWVDFQRQPPGCWSGRHGCYYSIDAMTFWRGSGLSMQLAVAVTSYLPDPALEPPSRPNPGRQRTFSTTNSSFSPHPLWPGPDPAFPRGWTLATHVSTMPTPPRSGTDLTNLVEPALNCRPPSCTAAHGMCTFSLRTIHHLAHCGACCSIAARELSS